jgi:hypothetical protein
MVFNAKSTWNYMTFFSQARWACGTTHFCTILHALGFGLPPKVEDSLSPLKLWVRILLDTTLCVKVCQWPTVGRWFSPSTPDSSTNKSDRHDITEILLKVPFSVAAESMQKWVGKQVLLRFSDVRNRFRCVCFLQFDWLIFLPSCRF